jgi:hypothetical protein
MRPIPRGRSACSPTSWSHVGSDTGRTPQGGRLRGRLTPASGPYGQILLQPTNEACLGAYTPQACYVWRASDCCSTVHRHRGVYRFSVIPRKGADLLRHRRACVCRRTMSLGCPNEQNVCTSCTLLPCLPQVRKVSQLAQDNNNGLVSVLPRDVIRALTTP